MVVRRHLGNVERMSGLTGTLSQDGAIAHMNGSAALQVGLTSPSF